MVKFVSSKTEAGYEILNQRPNDEWTVKFGVKVRTVMLRHFSALHMRMISCVRHALNFELFERIFDSKVDFTGGLENTAKHYTMATVVEVSSWLPSALAT